MTLADLIANTGRNGAAISQAAIAGIILTLLLSPLLSGLVVTAARAPAPAGFGPLLTGAFSEYGRMLRMLLWSIVPLGVALAIGAGALKLADKHAAKAILEADADLARHLALLVDGPAVPAGLRHARCGPRGAGHRPAPHFGRQGLVAGPGHAAPTSAGLPGDLPCHHHAGTGAVCAAGRGAPEPGRPGPLAIVAGLVVTLLATLVLAWMRSARLFALIDVKRSLAW